MTDEQLIEKIAEMLFTHDFEQEIDAREQVEFAYEELEAR